MNLKPNLWTVLFALSSVAFLYNYKGSNVTPEVVCCTDSRLNENNGEIPKEEAIRRFTAYDEQYIAKFNTSCDHLADSANVVSPFVVYFHIPPSDLEALYCEFKSSDVYASLSIKPGIHTIPFSTRDTLDLIFTDINRMDTSKVDNGKYFDFTAPCPPLCDTVPSLTN